MENIKTVSDHVKDGNWDSADLDMISAESCIIGEKYNYIKYPAKERLAIEHLANRAIATKDRFAWNDLLTLRETLAKFLHVRPRRKRKVN